jgi:hypothetical protein
MGRLLLMFGVGGGVGRVFVLVVLGWIFWRIDASYPMRLPGCSPPHSDGNFVLDEDPHSCKIPTRTRWLFNLPDMISTVSI